MRKKCFTENRRKILPDGFSLGAKKQLKEIKR